jgi:hypothetical protein
VTITAEYHEAVEARPPCSGCTDVMQRTLLAEHGREILPAVTAPYQAHGADFIVHLCAACAVKLVKALSAVIVMRDAKAARDLRHFFGADKRKSRA